MLRNLHLRFIVSNVLVVIVSVALTALLAAQTTQSEFGRFMDRGDVSTLHRLTPILSDAYAKSSSWADIQATVENLSAVTGQRVAVADLKGVIVGDSANEMVGKTLPAGWLPPASQAQSSARPALPGQIDVNGTDVGYLFLNLSSLAPSGMNPPATVSPGDRRAFPSAVNSWVLLSASVAGVIAIIVTLVLSRRLLQPASRPGDRSSSSSRT